MLPDNKKDTHIVRASSMLAVGVTAFLFALPASAQNFTNQTAATGLGLAGAKDGGITWTDVNRDGCLDVFVNTNAGAQDSRLYISDCAANPTFTDVTTAQINGLTAITYERSTVSGDLTGDGYPDLLRNDSGGAEIYFNDGLAAGFTFGDASQDPDITYTSWPDRGFNTEGAGFLDYDGDGDLDVVLDNHNMGVVLLQNDGAGNLTYITSGVSGLPQSNSGAGDYLVVADLDLDGDTDIVARKGGTDIFTNRRIETGSAVFANNPNFDQAENNGNKGGVAVCDFNLDGRPDIFWTDQGTNQIWRNDGVDANNHSTFTAINEPATSSGVTPSGNIDTALCGDVDNDGDLDLFLTSGGTDFLYLNNGNFSFTRNNLGITGSADGEGAAFGDYDRDGDLDLIINQDGGNEVWRNETNNSNYIIIAPTQLKSGLEVPAYGATVVVRDGGGAIVGVREVESGSGHGVSGTGDVHFGFADPAQRYTATITYPDGSVSQVCFTPSDLQGYHRVQVLDTDPSTCVAEVCGDGTKTLDEGCDDGNTTDGDGCSASCEVEAGWQCQPRQTFGDLLSDDDGLTASTPDWYTAGDGSEIMELADEQGFYPITPEHRGQTYRVEFTPGDNDTIGAAIGYRPGESRALTDVDYYIFHWCQTGCGAAGVGARLSRVTQGGLTATNFINRTLPGIAQVASAATLGNTAFVQGQTYTLEMTVAGDQSIQISIDGNLEIDYDTGVRFGEGFALTSFDMSASPFRNISTRSSTSVCTAPECRDGNIDAGEQCDDGNDIQGDGCSSACIIEPDAQCANNVALGSTCVAIDEPADGALLTMEGTYSGIATAGATVTLTWRDSNGQVAATTTVTADGEGNWTAPTQGFADGDYELTASVISGAASASDVHTFTLDSATAVTLVDPADGSRTDDTTPTFSGTGEPGATVRVIVDMVVIGQTTVGNNGAWSFTPTTALAEGDRVVSVEAEDASGNIAMDGPHTFEIDLDYDNDGLTNEQERTIGTDIDDPDTDGDGVNDFIEVGDPNNPTNTDNDGNIDALDTDDDDDGTLTINEPGDADNSGTPDRLEPCTPDPDAIACPTGDPDGDGTPNDTDPEPNNPCVPDPNAPACDTGDADGDGITNLAETMLGTNPLDADTDGDGLCDGTAAVANVCFAGENAAGGQNSDTDGLIDALDPDDDNDGVPTANEDIDNDGDPGSDDTDNDGTPDYLDTDDDDDGVLTSNEPGDADNSGTPDRLEPCTPDADALACPTGDPDDDGTPNGTDPDPQDPCVPNANALACDSGDTDGDGITNGAERTIGTSPINADSDGDGLCDGTTTLQGICVAGEDAAGDQDSDNDGTIDALDPDDDDDGIDTADEDLDNDADPTNDDSDNDGTPNYLDTDDDGDGVDTADEDRDGDNNPTNDDLDNDGTPNYLDIDDDGDGVNTVDEDVNMNGDRFDDDTNMNGVPDFLDPCDPDDMAPACGGGDTDGDGTPNDMDPDPLDPCVPNPDALACPTGDTDGDGVPNGTERMIGTDASDPDSDGDGLCDGNAAVAAVCVAGEDAGGGQDSDMDGIIDALDEDDDGDGVPTLVEDLDMDGDPTNDDSDMDGTPNYLDVDDDGDGANTIDENPDPNGDGDPADAVDTDMDGTPDYLDPDMGMMADVTITAPLEGDTTTTTPTFAGTAEPGAEVEVFVDGTSVGTATADENGNWTFTIAEEDALDAGDHAVTAQAGGEMTGPVNFTVDADVTEMVSIGSPADGDTVIAGTVTVSGTADPGAEVEVRLDGEVVATVTADEEGNWSTEVEVGEGPHSLEAKNGAASDVINIEATPDSGGDGLMAEITSPADGDTTSSTPTFEGTATAGADVEVFVDGSSVGTATADDNGDWTFTLDEADALDAGDHTVSVTATLDGESVDSAVVDFVVDLALDDVDVLLIGGCSTGSGSPAGGSLLLLGVLGLLGLRRRRETRRRDVA